MPMSISTALCASAPALRPFFAKYLPRQLDRTRSRSSRARNTPNPQDTFESSQPVSYPKTKPPFSRDPSLNSNHGIPSNKGWNSQCNDATRSNSAKVAPLAQIVEANADIEMDDQSGTQKIYGYAYGSEDDRFSIEPALVPREDGGGSPAGNDSYQWRSYTDRDLPGYKTQVSGSNASFDGRGYGIAISYDERASDIYDRIFDKGLEVPNSNPRNHTFYRSSSSTAS
ncbi:MAG: hypothetical protein Q9187_000109 [Circinaria calcarea]